MKNKFITPAGKIILLIITVFVVLFAIALGPEGSYHEVLSRKTITPQHFASKHLQLNGLCTKTMTPETTPDMLHIETESKHGSLSIRITDESGAILFDEENLTNHTCEIEVSTPVFIRINAKKHSGRFDLQF